MDTLSADNTSAAIGFMAQSACGSDGCLFATYHFIISDRRVTVGKISHHPLTLGRLVHSRPLLFSLLYWFCISQIQQALGCAANTSTALIATCSCQLRQHCFLRPRRTPESLPDLDGTAGGSAARLGLVGQ